MLSISELNILAVQLTQFCSGAVIHDVFLPKLQEHIITPELLKGSKILLCERIGGHLVLALENCYLHIYPGFARVRAIPSVQHKLFLFSLDLGPRGIIYVEGNENRFQLRTDCAIPKNFKDVFNIKSSELLPKLSEKSVVSSLNILSGIDGALVDDSLFNLSIHPMSLCKNIELETVESIQKEIIIQIKNRELLGGSTEFTDIFGEVGRYSYLIHDRQLPCIRCGNEVKTFYLTRKIYYCDNCQKLRVIH